MSQRSKKEDGKKRSEYYSKRYDYYILIGYPVAQASKLAHRDLAKEFKQKDPTEEKPKPI